MSQPEAERALPPLRRLATLGLAGLVLAVAALFLCSMLSATQGHFTPQVVDLLVVCQYAKAMAEGHPFQYNPGEPASTGATSLLHTTVLAVAHAIGFRGEGLIAFAILLGTALYAASVLLARRIATRLAGQREGVMAGALVALGGPVVWSYLYGSDIALFSFLALWLLDRMLHAWETGAPGGMAAAGALLALARPEGLVVALVLGVAWTLGPGRRQGTKGLHLAAAWLPALAGLAVLATQRALTGQWTGTSVGDKSLLANYQWTDVLALVAEYGVDVIRGLLLGFYPSHAPVGFARGWASYYFPPLGLLLVLLLLAHVRAPHRTPVRLWTLAVGIVFALVSPNVFMGVHFNRYLIWASPGLLALAAAGLGVLVRLLARGDDDFESDLFHAGAGLCVLLGLLATLRFGALYGEMAGDVYRRDVKTAEWISRNLPAGVPMANLATSVEYLTGHRNLNLHGVTSPAFFGNRKAEREAGVIEALARLPAAERPPFLLTSVSAQEALGARHLVDGEPVYRSSSLSDELLIFRMRYDLLDAARHPYLEPTRAAVAGLREVDRLNVCDSREEAAHEYRYSSHLGNLALGGAVRVDTYGSSPPGAVMDAGRMILGRESFRVRSQGGRPLVVVMRTAASADAAVLRAGSAALHTLEVPEAAVVVSVQGQVALRSTFRPGPGWNEWVLHIPAGLVQEGATRLELQGRYAAFSYWCFQ
jgi:hypothetical protein